MIGTVELAGMEFLARHGCLPVEKAVENLFVVDFSGEYDMGAAVRSDNLSDAVDYGDIYDIVAREMAVPSSLLEHLAGRICDGIAARHPELVSFSVCVSKRRPPVNGVAAWSRVKISR
ncbi:MAG: dihydroneopterin aldolase [Bacteroidia bacterium]|nr:dihydroneopterin aldolase [Bacteroidia bacterium]